MPKEQPQQPFLFEEMAPAGEMNEAEQERKSEKEERFKIIENNGFVLKLEVMSPIRFEREYFFGKQIIKKREIGEGNYMESDVYGWVSKAMDEKARRVFHGESSEQKRALVKRKQARRRFLEGESN